MSNIRTRLQALGIVLPRPMNTAGLPFVTVRIAGQRALIAGHVPTDDDGKVCGPFGKVGADVDAATAAQVARRCALGMLASLEHALGDLDRIAAWLRLFGMVNAAPGFDRIPPVVNGASDLILQVFGPEVGAHARSAVGMAELPFGVPVEIEGEVLLR